MRTQDLPERRWTAFCYVEPPSHPVKEATGSIEGHQSAWGQGGGSRVIRRKMQSVWNNNQCQGKKDVNRRAMVPESNETACGNQEPENSPSSFSGGKMSCKTGPSGR